MSRTKTPTDTLPRVFRGGSWYLSSASAVRAAFRNDGTPMYRDSSVGFRCAQRGCRQPVLKGVATL